MSRRPRRLRPFRDVRTAVFLSRPNRFLVRCRDGRRRIDAYLPNPGRLGELLLPGRKVYYVEAPPGSARATRFTAVAVERGGRPICLETHLTNQVARFLIEAGQVPGLAGARVLKPEHRVGRSRFDFLLEHAGEEVLLEVKSCTLVSGQVAMFPDAVTARGRRHLEELAGHGKAGTRTAVLFVVHWPEARLFSPDFHTDLAFARTMVDCRDSLELYALSVGWEQDLSLRPRGILCEIPWPTIEAEAQDRGSYLLLLELPEKKALTVGSLGTVTFRKGTYVYVGSAMRALTKRIDRHRRRRKKMHWHVDWLRDQAEVTGALAIRASDRLEHELAAAVGDLSDWQEPGFGCSDCRCDSHLFGFRSDPRRSEAFQEMLLRFRMDRFGDLARSGS